MNTGTFTLGKALNLDGGDGSQLRSDQGGNGGTLTITSSDSITANAPITATSVDNGHNVTSVGHGVNVNLTAANTVALNNTIQVSSSGGFKSRSNRAGDINVTSSKTTGTAISVSNSAQILALLNSASPGSGGAIKFVSAGGDVNVNGAKNPGRWRHHRRA